MQWLYNAYLDPIPIASASAMQVLCFHKSPVDHHISSWFTSAFFVARLENALGFYGLALSCLSRDEPKDAARCRKMPAVPCALQELLSGATCDMWSMKKSASDLRDAVWHLLHTCCIPAVSLAPARSKHVQPDPLPVFPIIRALSRRLNQRWDLSWHCETSLEHAWTKWCRITLEPLYSIFQLGAWLTSPQPGSAHRLLTSIWCECEQFKSRLQSQEHPRTSGSSHISTPSTLWRFGQQEVLWQVLRAKLCLDCSLLCWAATNDRSNVAWLSASRISIVPKSFHSFLCGKFHGFTLQSMLEWNASCKWLPLLVYSHWSLKSLGTPAASAPAWGDAKPLRTSWSNQTAYSKHSNSKNSEKGMWKESKECGRNVKGMWKARETCWNVLNFCEAFNPRLTLQELCKSFHCRCHNQEGTLEPGLGKTIIKCIINRSIP